MNYIYDHQNNRDIHVPHKYHEELGRKDFMQEHYSHDSTHKFGGITFIVHQKILDDVLNAPNYVVEVNGPELNFICFERANDVNSYLCSIQP